MNQENGGVRGRSSSNDLTRSQRKEFETHIIKLREVGFVTHLLLTLIVSLFKWARVVYLAAR